MTLTLTEAQVELIYESLRRSQGAYEALAFHAHNRNNIEQFKSLARDCAALLNDIHTHSYRSSDSISQKMADAGFTRRPSRRSVPDNE